MEAGYRKGTTLSLAQRAVQGILWTYASYVSSRLLTMLSTAILARILIPADFGLMAFALLLLSFIGAMGRIGVNEALIYASDHPQDTADTAFLISIGVGLVQYGIAFGLAPLLTSFVDAPNLVPVIRVMSLTLLITSWGQVHDTLLQKELAFRRRFIPDLLSALLKGFVSILLAFLGFGVWSLVYGQLIGAAGRTVMQWQLLPWRPRLRFYTARASKLWSYGSHIFLFNVLDILLAQADQVTIGVLLGEVQLGYYTMANKLPTVVITSLSLMLTRVLFPTYTKIRNDVDRLTRGFLAATKYTAFVTVGTAFGLAAVAPELVLLLFGEQWQPSIMLLRVAAMMAMVLTLPWGVGDVFKAIGRPDISTKLLFVESLYTFPLIWIMVSQSRLALMAGVANLIALSVTMVLRLGLVSRYLGFNAAIFLRIFRAPLIGGVVMAAVITLWRICVVSWPLGLVLCTSVAWGLLVYAMILWFMERKDVCQAREMLCQVIRPRAAVAVIDAAQATTISPRPPSR